MTMVFSYLYDFKEYESLSIRRLLENLNSGRKMKIYIRARVLYLISFKFNYCVNYYKMIILKRAPKINKNVTK